MRNSSHRNVLLSVALAAPLAVATWAAALNDIPVTLDQVPAEVRETILREAAGAPLTEIEQETQGGVTVYEAEFMSGGHEIEIRVAADGTLLGRAVESTRRIPTAMSLDQWPEPARAAVIRMSDGARFTEVEQELRHGVMVYEAEWSAGGVNHEAVLTADGTVVETEETIPFDSAPAAVRAAAAKHFGAQANIVVEKKMIIVYELETRINGREHEILVLPTGQIVDEDDDEDEDEDEDEDGDDRD